MKCCQRIIPGVVMMSVAFCDDDRLSERELTTRRHHAASKFMRQLVDSVEEPTSGNGPENATIAVPDLIGAQTDSNVTIADNPEQNETNAVVDESSTIAIPNLVGSRAVESRDNHNSNLIQAQPGNFNTTNSLLQGLIAASKQSHIEDNQALEDVIQEINDAEANLQAQINEIKQNLAIKAEERNRTMQTV